MRSWLTFALFYGQTSIFAFASSPDSTQHKRIPASLTFSDNLSASYTTYKNWKYGGYNNFSFQGRLSISFDSTGNNFENHLHFNTELGYMKFADSSWYKNLDNLEFTAELIRARPKRFTNAFGMSLKTQLLSDYSVQFNDSGQAVQQWSGGIGNPMTIDLSYGTSLKFWKTCRITLMYVTLRTSVQPMLSAITDKEDFVYRKSVITSRYGLSLTTSIRHKFAERISWENYSTFFGNAVNRNNISLDFRNRFIFRILKYMDLILDTRIRYQPAPPYLLQFRNELMLSFTLEKL